jgi:putative redox protein
VEARGSRVDEHPKVYDAIEVVYKVRGRGVDPEAVEKAIELSKSRYCPASPMVGKAADISSRSRLRKKTDHAGRSLR